MNPSQDNISNNVYESDITGFINNNHNSLPQTTVIQAEHSSNINCNYPSCNCNNNNGISVINSDISPAHTSVSSGYNNYQQSMSHGTSNNNDIISSDHNYQQPISNDASNSNVNVSSDYNYLNNASTPQFYPRHVGQNSPQYNSPGMITINSPQTYIIIMPAVANS